jgi:hypothetical protein
MLLQPFKVLGLFFYIIVSCLETPAWC